MSEQEKYATFKKLYDDLMSKSSVLIQTALEIKNKILDNIKLEEEQKENE